MDTVYQQARPVTGESLVARSLQNASLKELEQIRKDWIASVVSSGALQKLETLALVYGKVYPYRRWRFDYREIVMSLDPSDPGSEKIRFYYYYHFWDFNPRIQKLNLEKCWLIFIGGEIHFEWDNKDYPNPHSGRMVCKYIDRYSNSHDPGNEAVYSYQCNPGDTEKYNNHITPGPWLDRLLEYAVKAQAVVDENNARQEEEARQKLLQTLCIDMI